MMMKDWSEFLENFLQFSDYPILGDKGKVSALEAKLKAEAEYNEFRVRQDREYVSDFDRGVKRVQGSSKHRVKLGDGDDRQQPWHPEARSRKATPQGIAFSTWLPGGDPSANLRSSFVIDLGEARKRLRSGGLGEEALILEELAEAWERRLRRRGVNRADLAREHGSAGRG